MNKFQFLGRLTKEVEVRAIPNTDKKVSIFDLAVNRKFTNKDGQREADFFHITAFGTTGDFCAKYFKKGKQVLVEGRIQNRTYVDQSGSKRYATDFIAEQVYFTDSAEKTNKENLPIEEGEYITIDENIDLPF